MARRARERLASPVTDGRADRRRLPARLRREKLAPQLQRIRRRGSSRLVDPDSGLVTQSYNHLWVTLQVAPETSGLHAVFPTPAHVASVAGQEHWTCRRARDKRDTARSMSRTLDRKERPVTEDIDTP
jgi:hypothetical protein